VPPPAQLPLTRRRALHLLGGSAGAGLLGTGLLSGCTAAGDAPEPDAVADALAALWAGERRLVDRYEAVLGRFPALAPRLASVRDDHLAHADALRSVLEARRSPTAGVSASATAGPPAVPATAAAALAELAGAEAAAASASTSACLRAQGDAAALLASIAACEASHLVVLR
jgi:hypothetical protein